MFVDSNYSNFMVYPLIVDYLLLVIAPTNYENKIMIECPSNNN